jgi:hypothetical protein
MSAKRPFTLAELCERIFTEKNPNKLAALVAEMQRLNGLSKSILCGHLRREQSRPIKSKARFLAG